jgi:hypothetical protein
MPAKPIQLATAILFAAAFPQAQGQTTTSQGQTTTSQSVSQVFSFTYMQGAIPIQQLTNAVRTVAEITQSTLKMDAKTLAVTGTPAQLAMAAWIFTTMDQPAPANHATQEYLPAGSVNDVVRVLYLTQSQTPQSYQEIVNAVRTIPEIAKAFPYTPQNAIVVRGTSNQVAMAEWLFHQLDAHGGLQPAQSSSSRQYTTPGVTNDEVQVLFLSHAWDAQTLQQIANTLRVIAQLTKVFQCNATGALSVRGPATSVGLAAWLFSQLDQAPRVTAPAPREFQMPGGADDVTQVFYLAPATTAEALQSLVSALRTTVNLPVFPDDLWNAVALRGTAAQIATADSLIKQMNQP